MAVLKLTDTWKTVLYLIGAVIVALFGAEAFDYMQGESEPPAEMEFAAAPPNVIPDADVPQLIDQEPNVKPGTYIYVYEARVNCRKKPDIEIGGSGLPKFKVPVPNDDYTTIELRVTNPYVLVRDPEAYVKNRKPCKKYESEFESLDYLNFVRSFRQN